MTFIYVLRLFGKEIISRLLKNAPGMRRAGICGVYPANAGYASAFAAHVPLKYALLLNPRDALQLNIFEQPVKGCLQQTTGNGNLCWF
ncbi:MAG: hypothetical protein CVU54_16700 [Deltaproteobacteria bacterium HGW-Deltaproteobacteria-12]|jgi:hypothetical protein|nr:MAG: hypothetical protein CVU54_16700 [Deltaproteobacteria bacterium HGW-Deltaproteobacteria-12]